DAGSKAAGGSLGWLTKGGMPGAFDDAAFAMRIGEVRGPVKTDFGWHVIKLDQLRGGTRQPFENVRAQLEKELLEGDRERAFNELSGKLVDAIYKNPNSLEPAAKSLGLVVQTTPAFSRDGGPGIAADQKVLRAAFSETMVRDGTASDPIELSPTRTVLIRVLEHRPEAALPLSQVGDAVVMAIRADRQRKAAEAAADALVKAARTSGLPAASTAAMLPMGEANDVRRGSFVPSREVVDAFFRVPRPQDNLIPVDKTEAGGQFIVFAIRAVRDGDIGQVTAEERGQLRQQLSQASGMQAQQAFVRAARGKYNIKIAEDRL
ncbi:MAG: peptidyl-prolyl cis-trans isomerase, partial [Thermomonas sp.]